MSRKLLFSLGPVGGFIGQARRTRDWWAGSFLLSWLTANALKVSQDKLNATIVSPAGLSENALFKAVKGDGNPEYDATLPNSFELDFSEGDPAELRNAVIKSWTDLADSVWQFYFESQEFASSLEHIGLANFDRVQLKARWDEQIGGPDSCFWETIWVEGNSADTQSIRSLMAIRKRNRQPFFVGDVGPGERCMMMPEFRELSGFRRVGEGQQQAEFWAVLRNTLSLLETGQNADTKTSLNLGASERLSAPALVKRLFPLLGPQNLEKLFGWKPPSIDLWQQRAEEVVVSSSKLGLNVRFWPSTTAISMHHWLDAFRQLMDTNKVEKFIQSAHKNCHVLASAERQSRLWEKTIWGAGAEIVDPLLVKLCALDGNLFYKSSYKNTAFVENYLGGNGSAAHRDVFDAFDGIKALDEEKCKRLDPDNVLTDVIGKHPSQYYAVLQMDGDAMGVILESAKADLAKKALEKFAIEVRGEVGAGQTTGTFDHLGQKGEWLYATADEVRAIMPIEDALPTARKIKEKFDGAFNEIGFATVSASIIFARNDLSLSWVMKASDELLARAKKNANGDALGLSILNFGDSSDEIVFRWDND